MPKTVFLHGRPAPHPLHASLARSVNADFLPIDYLLRFHDRKSTRFYRYVSGMVCGMCLRRDYSLIIAEGSHTPPVVAKKLGLLRQGQKIAALMGSETLYFIKTQYYSKRTCRLLIRLLSNYDVVFCIGMMQTNIARELLDKPPRGPVIVTISPGFSQERGEAFRDLAPRLDGNRLLLIANGPGEFRAWYKGLDLVLEALALASTAYPDLELVILGEWEAGCRNALLARFPQIRRQVRFAGPTSDLAPYVTDSCLYVHLARGDAFPICTLEMMAAGLPAIVSEWTGSREAVEQVDASLVVPLDARAAADRIVRYMSSPLEERQQLSTALRQLAYRKYTQAAAIERFRAAVGELIHDPVPV
jgi:glycosyltransferase involved in cell wall biosynthesis